MPSIWDIAIRQFEQKKGFVSATILSVQGSSPRQVGATALILGNGDVVGTIGGGLFEATVRDFAMNSMKSGGTARLAFAFRGEDAKSDQMICGGSVDVLVEYVRPEASIKEQIYRKISSSLNRRAPAFLIRRINLEQGEISENEIDWICVDETGGTTGDSESLDLCLKSIPPKRLLKPAQLILPLGYQWPLLVEWVYPRSVAFILGAGHVGACVSRLASFVDFRIIAIDDREEFANRDNLPDADEIAVTSFDKAFSSFSVDQDSYIIIVTRGHAHDKVALAQALSTNAAYIGMIGSRRKIKLIYDSLIEEGFNESDLARVHAPIGLPIGGETPEEIAVSIVAEMIQERTRKLNNTV